MARKPRFVADDSVYHVLTRGHNKKQIFHDDADFSVYLDILLKYKKKFKLEVYHYSLMDNHTHTIMKANCGSDLSDGMKGLNQTYAQYYRKKYGGVGYIWQDRFKSFLIQSGVYLLECGRYIEVNSVKAGIVKGPEDYKWSSYRFYALGEKNPVLDFSPEYLALTDDVEGRKREYIKFIRDGLHDKRSLARHFRNGAYGDAGFIEKMKAKGLKQADWKKGRPITKK